jgi:nucleotide-binding universal stress UspA family protein
MGPDPLAHLVADPNELEAQARRELYDVVDGVDEGGLVASIERAVICDDPAHALVESARDADLLVVGSQGLGSNPAIGSVSQRVIRDAPCPVVVVPAGRA